jgi:hypothetical protein
MRAGVGTMLLPSPKGETIVAPARECWEGVINEDESRRDGTLNKNLWPLECYTRFRQQGQELIFETAAADDARADSECKA